MISIEIDDRAVRAALERLHARLSDLTPVMASIAQALESETEYRFEREGPGWPRLKPRTIAAREKKGYWPGKMLQRTGRLAASIDSRHGREFAEVGSNARTPGGGFSLAAIHQLGAPRRGIPPRPFLPIDADGGLTDVAQATVLERLKGYLDSE